MGVITTRDGQRNIEQNAARDTLGQLQSAGATISAGRRVAASLTASPIPGSVDEGVWTQRRIRRFGEPFNAGNAAS